MDIKRRDFLKIAGLSAVAGVGASSALNMLLKGDVHAAGGESNIANKKTGRRMGLLINTRKFVQDPELAQKCTDACHTNHNVPDFGNPKDEIKWIWQESYKHAFTNRSRYKRPDGLEDIPILVLCNHCDKPPCVRACPTKATFKDKDGVIVMDFHRCIGCRFCMAACPYGARSFNWRDPRGKDEDGRPFIANINPKVPTRARGVVEKCNFCKERLAKGLIPACVEAAGTSKAIIFGDLNDPDAEISRLLRENYTIQRKPTLGTYPSVFYII